MSRPALLRRLAPIALLLLLGAGVLLPLDGPLRLESGDGSVAERWTDALDALPADADVLVGFDPDVGTYAEIRPTVRLLLADLLGRQARLAFVSLTPEGRALAIAEIDRLARLGANPGRITDLGFLPGAEAALVHLTRTLPDPVRAGAAGRQLAAEGIAGVEAIVVVGGNDLGPRSWVEQVAPRVDGLSLLAVAPSVLLPELQPYLATGQLDALVATPRDGAAYRASATPGTAARFAPADDPPTAAVLLGLLVAALVLAQALGAALLQPGAGERDAR
jgi:hypothetical protein